MKPRVFVTQENPSLNYLPAESFGEIVFLTREDFSAVKNSLNNLSLVSQLKTSLKSFDPKVDFITVSGSPIVSAAIFMLLGQTCKEVTMLRWSNRDRVYQPVHINLHA